MLYILNLHNVKNQVYLHKYKKVIKINLKTKIKKKRKKETWAGFRSIAAGALRQLCFPHTWEAHVLAATWGRLELVKTSIDSHGARTNPAGINRRQKRFLTPLTSSPRATTCFWLHTKSVRIHWAKQSSSILRPFLFGLCFGIPQTEPLENVIWSRKGSGRAAPILSLLPSPMGATVSPGRRKRVWSLSYHAGEIKPRVGHAGWSREKVSLGSQNQNFSIS